MIASASHRSSLAANRKRTALRFLLLLMMPFLLCPEVLAQGTAEGEPFSSEELSAMLEVGGAAIREVLELQRQCLGLAEGR